MSKVNNKTILVTGCAGFVGSNLVDFYLKKKFKVIGIDNFNTGKRENLRRALKNKKFKLVKADLLKNKNLGKYFKKIDTVIHLAANADVRFGPDNPKRDLEQNLIVTSNILELIRINNVKKIIFSSTGSVYGEATQFPTPEDAKFPIQTSFYAASKLACEGLISSYAEAYNFKCWIFRFVSVLGPRYSHGHVFDFYNKIRKNEKLKVLGNGNQSKSYIHIYDCINAIHISSKFFKKKINIINIGNNYSITVKQSLKQIQRILKSNKKPIFQNNDRGWVGDNPHILLSTKKLRVSGWKPKYSIMDSIAHTLDYLKKN